MSLKDLVSINHFYLEKLNSLKTNENTYTFINDEENLEYREEAEKTILTILNLTLSNIYGFTLSNYYGDHKKTYAEIITGMELFLSKVRNSYESVDDYMEHISDLRGRDGIKKN
jgi:hypothetical protein